MEVGKVKGGKIGGMARSGGGERLRVRMGKRGEVRLRVGKWGNV